MQVTCPHCSRSFDLKLRQGNYTNKKANEARKRNGILGGRKTKVSYEALEHIFLLRGTDWTATPFMEAIEKGTGHSYSLSRASVILNTFKATYPDFTPSKSQEFKMVTKRPDGTSSVLEGGLDEAVKSVDLVNPSEQKKARKKT